MVTTIFAVGLVTNNTAVGHCVVAENVIRIITAMFAAFTHAMYSNVVQLVQKSRHGAILLNCKIKKYIHYPLPITRYSKYLATCYMFNGVIISFSIS
jgi:hypothetical protein